MPIAYLCLIIYSFVASQVHWPFGNLALILGFMLLLADIIIQVIRMALKKTTYHVLLLAFSLSFISVGYMFPWLYWPGMKLTTWLCLILALPGIILSFKLKGKVLARKLITGLMFVLLTVFSLMKASDFYCFKHNVSKEDPMKDSPVFVVHRLAFLLYREDEHARAQELLEAVQEDVNRKTAYYRADGRDPYLLNIFVKDSAIVSDDLKQVKRGSWPGTPFLIEQDVRSSELN